MSRSLYDVLGIGQDASQRVIRRAFRRMALDVHPELNRSDPGAPDRFRSVKAAYDVLSDPTARAAYDERLVRMPRRARRPDHAAERALERELEGRLVAWREIWPAWEERRATCVAIAEELSSEESAATLWRLYSTYRECSGLCGIVLDVAVTARGAWDDFADALDGEPGRALRNRRDADLARSHKATVQARYLTPQVAVTVRPALDRMLRRHWTRRREPTELLLGLLRLRHALGVTGRLDQRAVEDLSLPRVQVGAVRWFDERRGHGVLRSHDDASHAWVRLSDIPGRLPPAPGARFSYVARPVGRGVEATQVFAEVQARPIVNSRSADELLHEFIRHRR